MATAPAAALFLLFTSFAVGCSATIVSNRCLDRLPQCRVRWGWARQDAGISIGNVQYVVKSSIALPLSRWMRGSEPSSSVEYRRSNMLIQSVDRQPKPTKIDLIAGILLIYVCDMLLLSFTF
ncbi:hypothetical protein Q1695_002949 [Nippostrongylus brasiliensis]|nr:hypothetical protein Q1695_002949 [Nippostrongylus brasiliensis]